MFVIGHDVVAMFLGSSLKDVDENEQSHITWDPQFSLSNDTLKHLSKIETVAR